MQELFNLKGEVALITGASSGLGAHFAKTLGRAGAKVIVAARRIDRLERLAETLSEENLLLFPLEMDVLDADSIEKAIKYSQSKLGPITILINNAGVPSSGRAIEMDEAEWDRVIDTNIKGAWLVAREVARGMVENNIRGRLINMDSIIGVNTSAKRV